MIPIIQTISSKGQIVIPAKLRKHLNWNAGTHVAISMDNDSLVQLRPVSKDPVKDLTGMLLKYNNGRSVFGDMLKEKRKEVANED